MDKKLQNLMALKLNNMNFININFHRQYRYQISSLLINKILNTSVVTKIKKILGPYHILSRNNYA